MIRSASLRALAVAASLPPALALLACRGGGAPPPAAPAPPPSSAPSAGASAGGTAASPPASASSSPSEVPSIPPPPPPSAGSTKVTVKNDPAWAACHRGYDAKKRDPGKDVAAMAQACAKVTRLKPIGKALTGSQSDQDPPQSFPLRAEAGRCYRVFAQASEGIKDLDLAIKDSTGAIAGEDSTDDPSPVVLEDGAVCFKEADAATVVVSVGMGKGTYAVEVWSD